MNFIFFIFAVKEKAIRIVVKFLAKLYKSKPDEHVRTKKLIGFIIGLLSALGFRYILIEKLDVSPNTRRLLGTSLGCVICLGSTFSIGIRCVLLLVVPVFFGRSGRNILSAMALSLMIQGPIENMTNNMEEMARVFTCAGDMAINLTLHRLELIYHPVHQVLRILVIAGHDIQGKVNLFTDALYPLILMLEDDTEIKSKRDKLRKIPGVSTLMDKVNKMEEEKKRKRKKIKQSHDDEEIGPAEKLERKIITHCIEIVTGPIRVCDDVDQSIKSHFDNLQIDYEGSQPPDIGEFCDDGKGPGTEFDKGYFAIKNYAQQIEEMFDIDVVFPKDSAIDMLDFKNVEYSREKLKDEFSYRVKVFKLIANILYKALGFMFITVLISAVMYHRAYLTELNFDNCYITSYFRKIDKRRKKLNKRHLLPLKYLEKLELIRANKMKMLPEEKRKLKTSFVLLFPQFLMTFVLIIVDQLIAYIMDLIGKHAEIDYQSIGIHTFDFKIQGDSLMAIQLKEMFLEIKSEKHLNVTVSNKECLPNLSKVDTDAILRVVATYVLIFAVIKLEAYGLRLRRIVAAFCYYKREKQRILWLYNTYLKKRSGTVEYQIKKIEKLARKNEIRKEGNLLLFLRETYPKYFNWLRKVFESARRNCLICETIEKNEEFQLCLQRQHAYCYHCWQMLQKSCVVCNVTSQEGSDDSEVLDSN